MSESEIKLPIPVLEYPHWRVCFRPNGYKEDLIPTLSKCFDTVEKNKLSLRGWDYPHLSREDTEREQGNNWVASWSDFMSHNEYWRFYQSGQFIHLFSIRESTEGDYKEKLRTDMKSHRIFDDKKIDWDSVPGFFSIINFIYNVTEIYEFAARLCQSDIYSGKVNIQIDIKGIKDFILTASGDRLWTNYYAASQNVLTRTHEVDSKQLIEASKDISLEAIVWFFERFGWMEPPMRVIRQDQENLIKGKF